MNYKPVVLFIIGMFGFAWYMQSAMSDAEDRVDKRQDARRASIAAASAQERRGLEMIEGCLAKSEVRYTQRPSCTDERIYLECLDLDTGDNRATVDAGGQLNDAIQKRYATLPVNRFWDPPLTSGNPRYCPPLT